ncbi:hypothetical protein Hamer_G000456 [Homarus americanus]|uniref:Uncharacterized protein n=1 Tax=Homarus americanus TaxID=6706 RepID=A0A8J5TLS9_HOMAM|nr:hypothetical protein Hamer_G000456 [Homarus americanus]
MKNNNSNQHKRMTSLPGEPTTRQMTELHISIKRLSEQLKEYDTRPHPRNLICLATDKVIEEYKVLYMSCVNAHQQALNTQYLYTVQPVINALANITLGDDDGITNDDIEVGD